ncbi:protein kinase C-binding protein 1 [Platysternon megacephalum]|uniref:Protein kinase C-binding protein 1 n=1 Tax=Platysternon megacephalum TaxID=55544 RepID=A0A4D9EN37_9SAUR|nr:protein kinase C-binding protein 1 [Platysternon megacephalum]
MIGGLIVDIHGQMHPEQWVELGFTLSKASLNSGKFSASGSSICYLAIQVHSVSFETLLRGSRSLGKFIDEQDNNWYLCVPSPTNPKPKTGSYYNGGFIMKTFGSRYTGIVAAIHIELPQWVRDIKEYPKFCKALARAIINF